MNTSSINFPEPIAGDIHETMRDALRDGFPRELVDEVLDMQGGPHRLAHADIRARVEAMRGSAPDRVRAVLQQILDEDELYRWGYDLGYEAGFDRAVEEMNKHLQSVRPEPPRPSGAAIGDQR